MSVGNQTQAVDFDQQQLTLVLGENLDQGGDDSGSRNGTGKTTIINALSYALFGSALTSIKKDNLINKTNSKNMLVTVDFSVNNDKPDDEKAYFFMNTRNNKNFHLNEYNKSFLIPYKNKFFR